jgi:hypothetical protein
MHNGMNGGVQYRAVIAACMLVCSCGTPPANSARPETARETQPEFVGKAWMSTNPSDVRGTLRIFLPDGTLIMDSCWETYRLAQWQMTGDRQIEWQEDTARIAAEITQLTDERLQLRLRLTGGLREENYRRVSPPFVCPDMPR